MCSLCESILAHTMESQTAQKSASTAACTYCCNCYCRYCSTSSEWLQALLLLFASLAPYRRYLQCLQKLKLMLPLQRDNAAMYAGVVGTCCCCNECSTCNAAVRELVIAWLLSPLAPHNKSPQRVQISRTV